MATETLQSLNIRIPKSVYAWLEKESQKLDQPLDELASVLIEEAMRVEQFPGIFFRGSGGARRARLHGGMDVWEMIMIYRDHGRVRLLEAFDFPEVLLDRALEYYEAYPHEIDAWLWENSQPPEYWIAKYPELKMEIHKI